MVGTMSGGRTEIFYSKSKNKADLGEGIPPTWRRQLSNFAPVEVTIDGRTYPSVEAAFQAAKAQHSSKPEMARKFEVGGSVGPDPAAAKQHGSKKVYKAEGAVLKVQAWDAARDAAMFRALQARLEVDAEFRKILEASKEANVRLVHYERSGARSYWGGAVKDGEVVGTNKLGKMLMALREGKGGLDGDAVEVTPDVMPEAQAGPAPPTPPAAGAAGAAGEAAPPPPSLASMGRASSSVGAVSFVRRVFTARAIRLAQLESLGYKVGHLQGMSPADVDRQMQDQELSFVVSGTSAAQRPVHVRFHIDKALRQVHINTLAEEFRELDGFDVTRDTVVLISKDLPNDSVRAAVVSARASGGPHIIIQALAELQFNVLTHRDVPPHRAMGAAEIKAFREKYGLTAQGGLRKLAGISQFDPVARAMLFRPGTVCEITRPSVSAGSCVYYRLCE